MSQVDEQTHMGKQPPIHHIPDLLINSDSVLQEIASKYGTPLYVYDETVMERQWRDLKSLLPQSATIFYSVKANPCLGIVKSFEKLGASFEVASVGELRSVLSTGVKPDRILFTGPGKTDEELKEAVSHKLLAIVVESQNEIDRLNSISHELGTISPVALRLNLLHGSGRLSMSGSTQFGMDVDTAINILVRHSDYKACRIKGIHSYAGTGILDARQVIENTERLLATAKKLEKLTDTGLEFIDLGGGIGIPYFESEHQLDLISLSKSLKNLLSNISSTHPNLKEIAFESGRFLVGPAGILLTKVIDVKEIGDQHFIIVDGGTNIYTGHDRYLGLRVPPIRVIRTTNGKVSTVNLCGPLCTPTDRIAAQIDIAEPSVSDLIAIYQAGAYGLTASPVEFLSRDRPKEVMRRGSDFALTNEVTVPNKKSRRGFESNYQGLFCRGLPPYPLAQLQAAKDNYLSKGGNLIDLGQGYPDLSPPSTVIEFLRQAVLDTHNHHYPPFEGVWELRRAIADWYERRFGGLLNPHTEVLVLLGGKDGLSHLPLAVCDPDDIVLHPDPGYPVYGSAALSAQCRPYPIASTAQSDFLPAIQSIPESVTRKSSLLFANFPSNPTGAVASLEYLQDLVSYCERNDIVICHDAVYSELYYDKHKPFSILQVPNARSRSIEIHSLSKSYCMTGWRVGFAVGNKEIISSLAKVKTVFDAGVFDAIQLAAAYALDNCDTFLESIRNIYHERRDTMIQGMNLFGWDVTPPAGGSYVWARIIPTYELSSGFATECLNETGVLLTPGSAFGKAGEGFVRIALNADQTQIDTAMMRLKQWLGQIHW